MCNYSLIKKKKKSKKVIVKSQVKTNQVPEVEQALGNEITS